MDDEVNAIGELLYDTVIRYVCFSENLGKIEKFAQVGVVMRATPMKTF
jgi:hypothetical protein